MHAGQNGDWEQSARIYEGEIMLNLSDCPLQWSTSLVDEGRAVYVVYLNFSKPSDIVSHNTHEQADGYRLHKAHSEVDLKLAEWMGLESCNQQHKVHLEATH